MKNLTVEQRSYSIKSDAVAKLIEEVEAAAAAADTVAVKAREAALDPTIAIDVAQVSAQVTAAEADA